MLREVAKKAVVSYSVYRPICKKTADGKQARSSRLRNTHDAGRNPASLAGLK